MFLRNRWILTKPQPFFNNKPSSSSNARFSKMEDGGEDDHRRPKPQTTITTTTGDIMEDSFGHGYSTRSDDEGFGGIYGRGNHNQSLGEKSAAEEEDDAKKQGSQVKQREGEGAGRHKVEMDD